MSDPRDFKDQVAVIGLAGSNNGKVRDMCDHGLAARAFRDAAGERGLGKASADGPRA